MLRILTSLLFLLFSPFLLTQAIGAIYTDQSTGMELVQVQGGTFTMGSLDTKNNSWATPAHQVTIQDFYIGKFEVTFAQYDQFCEATGTAKPSDEGWGRDNRPVINVNWDDAVRFTQWLSSQSDRAFRLPSEAEWEYAFRAGTETKYWWGDSWADNMGNCNRCGSKWDSKKTAPAGSFKANPFGIYDMGGNVYEWCLDHEHDDYIGAPTDGSAWTGGPYPDNRITRGGSWNHSPAEFRSAARCWENRTYKSSDHGFRVVMEP